MLLVSEDIWEKLTDIDVTTHVQTKLVTMYCNAGQKGHIYAKNELYMRKKMFL